MPAGGIPTTPSLPPGDPCCTNLSSTLPLLLLSTCLQDPVYCQLRGSCLQGRCRPGPGPLRTLKHTGQAGLTRLLHCSRR